jgi:hypothetical protein
VECDGYHGARNAIEA